MRAIEVIPVEGLPEIGPGDVVADLIADAVELRDGDVVVVTQKIVFKAEGRPDTRPPVAGEAPLGARVRGVFQPQPKDDKKDKDRKDAPDAKRGKEPSASKANPPLPLKPGTTLDLDGAK